MAIYAKDLSGSENGSFKILLLDKARDNRAKYLCECKLCGKQCYKTRHNLVSKQDLKCNCQKKSNLLGKQFGLLTVTKELDIRCPHSGQIKWECTCICGNKTVLNTGALTSGSVQSCGCVNKNDLTGKTFGYLFVSERVGYINGKTKYKCKCECGKEVICSHSTLYNGNAKSCGCKKSELISLALGGTGVPYEYVESISEYIRASKEYAAWRNQCYKRDNYTCQISKNRGGNLHVHHKTPLNSILAQHNITKENYNTEFSSILFDLDNGITLSEEIHKQFHTLYGSDSEAKASFNAFLESYNVS